MDPVKIIDSHTAGEPTRVIVTGGPDLGEGSAQERAAVLARSHRAFCKAVNNEPRGSDHLVSALLLPSDRPDVIAQAIFFNNAGLLNMCVHGMIGVGATLAYLGRLERGRHIVETPVGDVVMELFSDGSTEIENVVSYRSALSVCVRTSRHGPIHGDIAWGGNWFFLTESTGCEVAVGNIETLTALARDIRESLLEQGMRGDDGGEIDHIELFGRAEHQGSNSKNFVLCPGYAYDRSPCGTGTSAKLACLAADSALKEGEIWRQESIIGSIFEGRFVAAERGVVPTIRGRAWITAESTLLFDRQDPFRLGVP